jgi:hypothetical protein
MKIKRITPILFMLILLAGPPASAKSYTFVLEAISKYQENPSEENLLALEKAQAKAKIFDAGTVVLFATPLAYLAFRMGTKKSKLTCHGNHH